METGPSKAKVVQKQLPECVIADSPTTISKALADSWKPVFDWAPICKDTARELLHAALGVQ
eukprot:8197291-Karenia_brevis.AAC.1